MFCFKVLGLCCDRVTEAAESRNTAGIDMIDRPFFGELLVIHIRDTKDLKSPTWNFGRIVSLQALFYKVIPRLNQ